MKKEPIVFYIHSMDTHTYQAIRLSYDNPEEKNILHRGESLKTHIFTAMQLALLEGSKIQYDLSYIIFTGNSDDGFTVWNNPKSKFSLNALQAIRAVIESRKKTKGRESIQLTLRNMNKRQVKLTRGDSIVYLRDKHLCIFLKQGVEPLTYAGMEGLSVKDEMEAIEFIGRISATTGRRIEFVAAFNEVIFHIK